MKEGGNYVVANGIESFQLGEIDHDADTDDSKDSDAIQLFELPKRKLVRPISSSLRRKVRPSNKCWATTKECCRIFVTVTLPMLIAVFIVSTILCLTFLLVGIASMKQEISMLKIRLKNVDAAEENFIGKKEQLRKQFQNKLNDLLSYQNELQKMKNSVRHLSSRVDRLNNTVHKLHNQPTSQISSKLAVLKRDLDTLKIGMADTGADIEKLKANGNQLTTDVGKLSKNMKSVNNKMYNMSVQISQLENKPAPVLKPTPKTLVVSLTPDQDKPVSRKELNVMLATSEKKQYKACKKEISLYDIRLDELRNDTLYMNETYSREISGLHYYLTVLQNRTGKPSITEAAVNVSHAGNSSGNHTTVNATSSTPRTVTPLTEAPTPTKTTTPSTVGILTNKTTNVTQTNEVNVNTTLPATVITQMNNTQSEERAKLKRGYNDVKADEILDKYARKLNISSLKNKNITPLLREYVKQHLKSNQKGSRTTQELDNLDIRNPV